MICLYVSFICDDENIFPQIILMDSKYRVFKTVSQLNNESMTMLQDVLFELSVSALVPPPSTGG